MAKERVGEGLESYLKKHPEALDGIVEGGAALVVELFGPDRKVVNRILRLMHSRPLSQKKIDQIDKEIIDKKIEGKLSQEKKEIVRSPEF